MATLFTDRAEAGRMLAERVLALHLPGPVNAGQDPRLFAGEVSDLILG
jgi:hypothetical protein